MKLAFVYHCWAVSIPRYFAEAFRALGHEVVVIGPAHGNYLPFTPEGTTKAGMYVDEKYIHQPDIELSEETLYDWAYVESMVGDVDFFMQQTHGWRVFDRPTKDRPHVLLATDSHVVNYDRARPEFDYVFNMHKWPMREGDFWLPYCYAPWVHYVEPLAEDAPVRPVDVACIGLQYDHRVKVVEELRRRGLTVHAQVGLIYDDYRRAYNKAKVAFTWATRGDTHARMFEAPRMGCALVCSRTADYGDFLIDNVDAYSFEDRGLTGLRESVQEAADLCELLVREPSLRAVMSDNGMKAVAPHTYLDRAERVIDVVRNGTSAAEHNERMLAFCHAARDRG